MPDIEELLSQFSTLGIELDDGTAAACLDICCRYSVDEEAFVNAWIAYSVSNLNGANPTVENLADFERKEFAAVKTPKRSTVSSNVQVNKNEIHGSILVPTYFCTSQEATQESLFCNF